MCLANYPVYIPKSNNTPVPGIGDMSPNTPAIILHEFLIPLIILCSFIVDFSFKNSFLK